MLRPIVWIVMTAATLFVAGCGFVFVARNQPYTPGYCYDCHHRPVWHRAYSRCEYYDIKVVGHGYYYRPHRYARHQEFKFSEYDFSHDKKAQEIKSKDTRDRKERKPEKPDNEKDKKTRR